MRDLGMAAHTKIKSILFVVNLESHGRPAVEERTIKIIRHNAVVCCRK